MKLSKRGEYGLRAMIDLASALRDPEVRVIQIRDVARRENIPAKFLEQILLTLKNAGLLQSKMGVGGGYYLSRPAEEITLSQIIRVLEGPFTPVSCLNKSNYEPCSCPDEQTCGLRMVMSDVYQAMSAILDCTTLADVVARVDIVKQALDSVEVETSA